VSSPAVVVAIANRLTHFANPLQVYIAIVTEVLAVCTYDCRCNRSNGLRWSYRRDWCYGTCPHG